MIIIFLAMFTNLEKLNSIEVDDNYKLFKFKLLLFFSLSIIFYFINKYIIFNYYQNLYKIIENNYNKTIDLEIDNKLLETQYEDNFDFSNFSTTIKPIAIYFPNIYLDDFKNLISLSKQDICEEVIRYYYDGDVIENISYSLNNKRFLENINFEYQFIIRQIQLAKTHGIYGFGIYIYWFSGNIFIDKYINQFLDNKNINFHFLFIFNNRNIKYKSNKNLINKIYDKRNPELIILLLKSYFLDERYIKIDYKPVICIDDDNSRDSEILKSTNLLFRKFSKQFGIGEIYLVNSLKYKNYSEATNLQQSFNAGYELLPDFLLNQNLLIDFRDNSTFFSGLIYKSISFKNLNKFPIFRGSTLENKIKIENHTIFNDYYPEYFYVMNKMIIDWITNFKKGSDIFFINAWNNYKNGAYLEPNPYFGYSSINSLSKALFNLSFIIPTYNFSNFINNILVAVQVHVFYIDLLNEVILNTNNIPVKFDLYITTDSNQKKIFIQDNLKKFSKAVNYKVKKVNNKGRDIYPLLIQMRKKFKKYKYICHVHTKKSIKVPEYGKAWRKYLFKNILGSGEKILTILADFEKHKKLGFVFPETFYEAKLYALEMDESLKNAINYLLNKMFKGYKMGLTLEFPAGDMFWAKSQAIYQIFINDFSQDICNENEPLTILYALERIWLYMVKLNGYYYKKTCEYY